MKKQKEKSSPKIFISSKNPTNQLITEFHLKCKKFFEETGFAPAINLKIYPKGNRLICDIKESKLMKLKEKKKREING